MLSRHPPGAPSLLYYSSARYFGRAEGEVERDVSVSFFNDSGKPVANFSWWEEAKNENVQIRVDVARGNLIVRFGDFDLGAGESVVLDPNVKIPPNADTYVNNSAPNTNYGSSPSLYVGSEHPDERDPLLPQVLLVRPARRHLDNFKRPRSLR
jgi:hypothetical protein